MYNPIPGARRLAVIVFVFRLVIPGGAGAQGVMVNPVNVDLAPGQRAAALTIVNQNAREFSFQIRGFGWRQSRTEDEQLTPTNELVVSPPLGAVAPGATQVVRLVLRQPPQGREATYRILIDELPPPSEAGVVRIALRLSIPVFAEPTGRVAPHLQWRIASQGGQAWLLALNEGTRHETVRDIALHTPDGRTLQVATKGPPHVLADGLRRWRILTQGPALAPGSDLRLTASVQEGTVDQQVRVDAGP